MTWPDASKSGNRKIKGTGMLSFWYVTYELISKTIPVIHKIRPTCSAHRIQLIEVKMEEINVSERKRRKARRKTVEQYVRILIEKIEVMKRYQFCNHLLALVIKYSSFFFLVSNKQDDSNKIHHTK